MIMGKVDENKKKKKETLFNSAYDLFVTKGINSTAILAVGKRDLKGKVEI